jgi:predicted GNAT family N-acyltransferase
MTSHSSLKIEPVTSSADLEAVYRLRYGQVGLPENNLEAPESLMFRDVLDTPAATILAVKAGNEIIGTMRMVPRSAGPFIWDDAYDWSLLSSLLKSDVIDLQNQTILYDRVVVQNDFRGQGLSSALFNHGARIAQAQEKKHIVIVASLGNISIKIMLKNGFQEYAQTEYNKHQMAFYFAQTENILNSN